MGRQEEAIDMGDLINRLSEVDEEDPAFDALMLRLGRALNYDSGSGFLEDVDLDSSLDQEISHE